MEQKVIKLTEEQMKSAAGNLMNLAVFITKGLDIATDVYTDGTESMANKLQEKVEEAEKKHSNIITREIYEYRVKTAEQLGFARGVNAAFMFVCAMRRKALPNTDFTGVKTITQEEFQKFMDDAMDEVFDIKRFESDKEAEKFKKSERLKHGKSNVTFGMYHQNNKKGKK